VKKTIMMYLKVTNKCSCISIAYMKGANHVTIIPSVSQKYQHFKLPVQIMYNAPTAVHQVKLLQLGGKRKWCN